MATKDKNHIMTNNINIKQALDAFKPDFKPGFESRVMAKITSTKVYAYSHLFNTAFKRIALSGAAAIIILLITIYLSDGSLSTDSLLGTQDMDIESYTAMMYNNY